MPESSSISSGKTPLALRVLHLEDNPEDAELIQAYLEQDGCGCQIKVAQGRTEFLQALKAERFDLILSDFSLPDYDGLTALRAAHAHCPGVPFILVSGTLGEEHAVESLKCGATDYILKNRLLRLPAAVRRALSDAEHHAQYQRAAEKLAASQELFSQILESVTDLVVVLDLTGHRIFGSPSYRQLLGEETPVAGSDSFANIHPEDADNVRRIFHETVASGVGQRTEYRFRVKDGSYRFIESQGSVIRDRDGQIHNILVVSRDITARKQAEAELTRTQQELVAASRQAGMAEVATGVLHNVGNVLNSVNVAAHCLADGLRKSRSNRLGKIVKLFQEHQADLGQFLTNHLQGREIPGYLAQLAEHLESERTGALQEIAHLQKNIEHIKDIITMQQSFARRSGLMEIVKVPELMEDALQMNASGFNRCPIQVVKEFAVVPPVPVDKSKLLQILINLIRNAQHACDESHRDDSRMTLRILSASDRVQISVSDNGVGIPPENLTRIFNHGFTTKKNGHGFGLHSGALAAQEMGGSLNVQSRGVGQGATFTLELPLQPRSKAHV
jgi:PAS domain S-box-containing protein